MRASGEGSAAPDQRLARGSPKSCPPLASRLLCGCADWSDSCYAPSAGWGRGMAIVLAETKLPGRVERPEAGVLVQRLSTDTVAPRDQYAYWKEAVCGIFVGLDC